MRLLSTQGGERVGVRGGAISRPAQTRPAPHPNLLPASGEKGRDECKSPSPFSAISTACGDFSVAPDSNRPWSQDHRELAPRSLSAADAVTDASTNAPTTSKTQIGLFGKKLLVLQYMRRI